MTLVIPRHCEKCGRVIPKPPGLSPYNYASRRYCDRACMSEARTGSHQMSVRYWPTQAAYLMDTSA